MMKARTNLIKNFLGALLLLSFAGSALAQNTTTTPTGVTYQTSFSNQWQTNYGDTPVPTTTTTIFGGSTYVTSIFLTDPTGTAVTVTIQDLAGDAVMSIPMGGTNPTIFFLPFPRSGKSYAGGVIWKASVAGVSGTVTGQY